MNLQDKLKLEADIKLLTRQKERILSDIERVEYSLKGREKELSSSVKKLTEEKKILLSYLQTHYKTLQMYEAIVEKVKKGIITFGSEEYYRAKEKADLFLEAAEGISKQSKIKLIQVKHKEATLNQKDDELIKREAEIDKEKAEIEVEGDMVRRKSQDILFLEVEMKKNQEKISEDTKEAQSLLKEAKFKHFKASTEAGAKVSQADELLGIIKRGLSDVSLERERIKGQKEYLIKKDEELKAIAIRLKHREARIKRYC